MALRSKNKIDVLPEIQGKVIKAAREKLRLDAQQLAHKACLSKKHITELEEGGISSFYSEAHKITVAKKVAKILELDESKVLVHPDGDAAQQESLPFDAESSDLNEVSAALEDKPAPVQKPVAKVAPPTEKVSLENLQSGGERNTSRPSSNRNNRNKRNWMPVLLLILVAVGLYSSKDEITALFVSPPQAPQALVAEGGAEAKPEEGTASSTAAANPSTTAPVPVPVPAPAPTTSASAPLPTDVSCPKADASIAEYSVSEPSKPGNFVYVQAKTRQIVCVVDATGKSSMQSIEAGGNHTFVGKAPFTVLTNGVSQTSIYFQGRPVKVSNDQAKTIRLKETQ
jgi:transcriptional regulator with XRE-family HTH domain